MESRLPHGIMFHHFHGGTHMPSQGSISDGELERLIGALGPRLVSAQQWLDLFRKNQLENEICLTFDDNLRCQYDIALPVLRKFNLCAFWFVQTNVLTGEPNRLEIYRHVRNCEFGSVEEFYEMFEACLNKSGLCDLVDQQLSKTDISCYLGEFAFYTNRDRWFRFIRDEILGQERYCVVMDQILDDLKINIKALGETVYMQANHLIDLAENGHILGLHSHSHPTKLAALSREDQEKEYSTNIDVLEELLGYRPSSMSHPCNSYNGTTLAVLESLGIEVGFRANMGAVAKRSLYEIPREDHVEVVRDLGL